MKRTFFFSLTLLAASGTCGAISLRKANANAAAFYANACNVPVSLIKGLARSISWISKPCGKRKEVQAQKAEITSSVKTQKISLKVMEFAPVDPHRPDEAPKCSFDFMEVTSVSQVVAQKSSDPQGGFSLPLRKSPAQKATSSSREEERISGEAPAPFFQKTDRPGPQEEALWEENSSLLKEGQPFFPSSQYAGPQHGGPQRQGLSSAPQGEEESPSPRISPSLRPLQQHITSNDWGEKTESEHSSSPGGELSSESEVESFVEQPCSPHRLQREVEFPVERPHSPSHPSPEPAVEPLPLSGQPKDEPDFSTPSRFIGKTSLSSLDPES